MNRPELILPLDAADAPLEIVGGKGRALAKLAAAGMPVPPGFLLSTGAYHDFVEANALQASILEHAGQAKPEGGASPNSAPAELPAMFEAANLPSQIATSITQAYAALGEHQPAVAVRSSATAEDWPGLSFAGQHDSYLNVRGQAALLAAIRQCWASLWSDRAISYRERMNIDPRTVAMGVVVQVMVPADVSGVLFTANPTSGDRTELVVTASFGLGEAIVGGQVTPDTYLLARESLECKETVIGTKETRIVSAHAQGTTGEPVPAVKRSASSLPTESLTELAALSLEVERLFDGTPQDIEWAFAAGKCWLLQSRPITNLPPAPLVDVSWDPPAQGDRLIRRQVVENMPDPLSPLFADLYLRVGLEQAIEQFMVDYGMPFSFDDLIKRPMFVTVNGYAYCRANYRTAKWFWVLPKVLYWYVISIRKILRNLIQRWREEELPSYLAAIDEWKAIDPGSASDQQLLSGVRTLTIADANYWFDVAIVIAAAKVTDGMLNGFLTSWIVPGDLTSAVFLRGFPSKSLQAQQDLEAMARRIQTTPSLHERVVATPAGDLLDTLEHAPDGQDLVESLHQYFLEYGHQIYTLDFAQPTQREDPLPVLLSLKALVAKERFDSQARQTKMAEERERQERATLKTLGPLRRWLFRTLLRWAQAYSPYREDALFYMGAAWPTLRGLALELGRRLVAAGKLQAADDVFYLDSQQLADACSASNENRRSADFGQLASRQRELREARKKLHPPGMVPENSRFRIGPVDLSAFETQKRNAGEAKTLSGFAVSPGVVTATASVILSPDDFEKMSPDTVLVCPTTTPAWTPLFGQAAALVTDIGGILAHGSIVAREYGIPAVMGTGNATERIVSGQQIAVDGNAGTVTILD